MQKTDFATIVKQIRQSAYQLNLANVIEYRSADWAANTQHCSHRHGMLHSITGDTSYKYEVIFTPDFLEITIHLDLNRDEYFRLTNDGLWYAKRDNERIASGGGGK
jgi:hypothetical protein